MIASNLLLVPVPDLSPPPGFYEPSWPVTLAVIIAMLGTIGFTWTSLASGGLVERGLSPWVPLLTTLAMMVGGAVVGSILGPADQAAHRAEASAHRDRRHALQADVARQLKATYGVDVESWNIPVGYLNGQFPRWNTVTWPDGTAERCEISGTTGYYEIRCGAELWDDATPLPAIEHAGGS